MFSTEIAGLTNSLLKEKMLLFYVLGIGAVLKFKKVRNDLLDLAKTGFNKKQSTESLTMYLYRG